MTMLAWYAEQGPYSGQESVCLSRRSIAAAACGWFAAERERLRQISIGNCRRAGAEQQMRVA